MSFVQPIKDPRKQLPEGWRWVKLGELCKQDRQIIEPFSDAAASLNYLSLEHIEPCTGHILKEPSEQVEDEGKSTTFRFDERHVLYGKLRPYLNKVALPNSPGRCTTEMIPLLPSGDVGRDFLAWLLRRQETVDFAMHGKTGSRMPRADMNSLLKLPTPLPPLSEQKRISAILNNQLEEVEKARAAAHARLDAAKALPSSLLRQLFPLPGQSLPKGWRWVKLGDYSIKVGSGITPQGGHASYLSTGIPLIRSQNVHYNRFFDEGLAFISKEQDKAMEGSRVRPEDILLNITGASIGRVCVVPERLCPANVNQHVSIIRLLNLFHPQFVAYYVSTPAFQRFILETQAGATRQALTKSLIENFQIPLASLSDQKQITETLNYHMTTFEKMCVLAEEELETIKSLPAALLRQAFNGDL